jgi:hypothetical protein
MTDLPESLSRQIQAHETRRDDAAGARQVLEAALTFQLRAIADGLVAAIVLRGESLRAEHWWYQHLSRRDAPQHYRLNGEDPQFLAFRKRFLQDVALGRKRAIRVVDLNDFPVRIFGQCCRFSQEGKINRQLAKLGSSLRLVVAGSHRTRLNRLRRLLGKDASSDGSADGRFAFGRIGPLSCFGGAALYLFERECAVSPYACDAEGFTDGSRIVIRQTPIRVQVEQELFDEATSSQVGSRADSAGQRRGVEEVDYEGLVKSRTRNVLFHEAGHILHDSASVSSEKNRVSLFKDAIREDVLRLARSPTTVEQIQAALLTYVGDWDLAATIAPALSALPSQVGFSLEKEISSLRAEGLLQVNERGQLYTPIYGEGRRWTL